ncbi:MAG: hypothetical protein JNN15_04660 [Blastocatellia bacterium]|nr:hypothetical protein [Blastocatellia bacterium]
MAKEAICHLLKQKGYHLADLREIFIDESRNICCNHTIELHLNVTNEEDGSIVATVW